MRGALIRCGVRGSLLVWLLVAACAAGAKKVDAALGPEARADRVIVHKTEHTLTLLREGQVLKTYKVALGGNVVGPKTQRGDHKTPEGLYILDRRNEHSHFYRSIHISYPSVADLERAKKAGVEPGGDVMIHGLQNGLGWVGSLHRLHDWTDGCVAVTDEEMDEIWRAVPDGTPIEIDP